MAIPCEERPLVDAPRPTKRGQLPRQCRVLLAVASAAAAAAAVALLTCGGRSPRGRTGAIPDLGAATSLLSAASSAVVHGDNVGGSKFGGDQVKGNKLTQNIKIDLTPENHREPSKALAIYQLCLEDGHASYHDIPYRGKACYMRVLECDDRLGKAWVSLGLFGGSHDYPIQTCLSSALNLDTEILQLSIDDHCDHGTDEAKRMCSLANKVMSRHSMGTFASSLGAGLLKNIGLRKLDVHYVGRDESRRLGDVGTIALAKGVAKNQHLEELLLENNNIGEGGAAALAQSLFTNTKIRHLKLSHNNIGNHGASALSQAMEHNHGLRKLELDTNKIDDGAAAAIGEALRKNPNLEELNLTGNSISSDGANTLAQALRENRGLRVLALSHNRIGPEGATALAGALAHDRNLRVLELTANEIGEEGTRDLVHALANNHNLRELWLGSNNRNINIAGMFALTHRTPSLVKGTFNLNGTMVKCANVWNVSFCTPAASEPGSFLWSAVLLIAFVIISVVAVAATTPRQELGQVFDSDSDPELVKNKGPYEKKWAFLQVTFRTPLDGPGHFCVLIYGFLPFVVPATFIIHWAIRRHFLGLYGFLVSIFTSILNDVVFKPIVNDPRPVESANKFRDKDGKMKMKPGMPSGHVLNATTIMVWALLEVAFRGPGFDKHMYTTLEWLIFILVLMAPVPWARWKNKDHSLKQCLVAGVIGVVAGIAAYVLRITYFRQVWKPWPTTTAIPGSDETDAASTAASTTAAIVATTVANSTRLLLL